MKERKTHDWETSKKNIEWRAKVTVDRVVQLRQAQKWNHSVVRSNGISFRQMDEAHQRYKSQSRERQTNHWRAGIVPTPERKPAAANWEWRFKQQRWYSHESNCDQDQCPQILNIIAVQVFRHWIEHQLLRMSSRGNCYDNAMAEISSEYRSRMLETA